MTKNPFFDRANVRRHDYNRIRDRKSSDINTEAGVAIDEDTAQSVNLLDDDSHDFRVENEKDIKSVDSDKTEDPQYPWDGKPKAKKSKERMEQMSPTIQESPTTKTLNILSQNMDDLQCEPCFRDQNKSRFSMPSAKTPQIIRDLPQGYDLDWEIHSIRIVPQPINSSSSPGRTKPLGAVISREAFPVTANGKETQKSHCLLKCLHGDGLAKYCGLQQGDWFLCPMEINSLPEHWSNGGLSSSAIQEYERKTPPKLATFDEILKWTKEKFAEYRPIRVLRKKNTAIQKARATASSANPVSHTKAKPPKESRAKSNPSSSNDNDTDNHDNKSQNSIGPPYCVLCNYYNPSHWSNDSIYGKKRTRPQRPPRCHHAWCPKNKSLDIERVEKRLARMKHCYLNLGCEACHTEYQTGKVVSVNKKLKPASDIGDGVTDETTHNKECRAYQRELQREERRIREQQEKEEEEARKRKAALKKRERTETKQHKKNNEKLTQRSNESKSTKRNKHKKGIANGYDRSGSSSQDSDEVIGYEDGSIYQPPTRKARMEALAFPSRNKELGSKKVASATEKRQNSKKNPDIVAMEKEFRRFDATTLREKTNNEPEAKQSVHEEDNVQVKPVWVPLHDNPWGEVGYQTGDVLLFGPQLGIGHHETHGLSTERYKVNPFGDESSYRNTHCAPEEGLALILLKRDPMGTIPWGFQTIRDEFGNACLVESVDSCSPASNASFLGVPACVSSNTFTDDTSTSSLNVNDMIVLINGKPVGGMTEVGLKLELEITGPNLLLGVSRYKHAKQVAERFAEMEGKMLDFMDRARRDDRLMGWREIGNGVDPREETRHAETKGLPSSQSEPTEENTTTLSNQMQRSDERQSSNEKERARGIARNVSENKFTKTGKKNSIHSTQEESDASHQITPTDEPYSVEQGNHDDSSSKRSEDSAAHDDNPQMGCVCGANHSPSRTKTFWIQCDSCDSWYHVAKKCIGFNENLANRPDFIWNCEVCTPDEDGEKVLVAFNDGSDSVKISIVDEGKTDCAQPNDGLNSKPNLENFENRLRNIEKGHSNGGNTAFLKYAGTDEAKDVAKPSDSTPSSAVQPSTLINHSEIQTESSRKKGCRSLENLSTSSTAQNHLEEDSCRSPISKISPPKRQKKKKPSTPLAIRQLKSYNRSGSGYWENYESKKIASDSDRCIRKRKFTTNESEGKDEVVMAEKSKNKSRDAISREAVTQTETLGSISKTERGRPLRKRVTSKTVGDSSDIPTVVNGKTGRKTTMQTKSFEVGDLVFVENHAWAYVNNSGGIGFIKKAYLSDDGDHIYDVKYPALDMIEKRILPEFINPYSFD